MSSNLEVKLKRQGICTVRQLLLMNQTQVDAIKLSKKTLKALRLYPLVVSAENITVCFETDKTTGTNIGHLKFDLVSHTVQWVKKDERGLGVSYNIVVGTQEKHVLLANQAAFLPDSKKAARKVIKLSFNWSLANSLGGPNGCFVVVRILSDSFRGLDVEYLVPLQ